MKKFSADTLDTALLEASKHFNCSVTQLEYEVIQDASAGIFGLWKKEAIIIASKKQDSQAQSIIESAQNNTQAMTIKEESSIHAAQIDSTFSQNYNSTYNAMQTDSSKQEDLCTTDSLQKASQQKDSAQKYTPTQKIDATKDSIQDSISIKEKHNHNSKKEAPTPNTHSHIDSQAKAHTTARATHTEANQNQDMQSICKEVQQELSELLSFLPLDLNKIEVEPYDDHTLFILIDGLDAALLIGQKGYRYKSLSYLLFNWVHTRYGYGVRLEIAQFLKNQEQIMRTYLEPIIESAKIHGKAQTKPLDGVLTHIALKMLREALPNKYIVFRETPEGEKYIIINEFLSTQNNPRNSVYGFGDHPKY